MHLCLTNNPGCSHTGMSKPLIASNGYIVHIVWYDDRNGNSGIYYKRSIDGGTNWEIDTRLTNNSSYSYSPSVSVSGTVLHVVWRDNRDGNYEIYYKRNPTGNLVGIENISSEIPEEFSLSQNYPNPFNPKTVISFQLSVDSKVLIKVYDVQGKEVETLLNERMNAGTYEVSFDASHLSSGVYFYRLTTDGFIETKSMMLIK